MSLLPRQPPGAVGVLMPCWLDMLFRIDGVPPADWDDTRKEVFKVAVALAFKVHRDDVTSAKHQFQQGSIMQPVEVKRPGPPEHGEMDALCASLKSRHWKVKLESFGMAMQQPPLVVHVPVRLDMSEFPRSLRGALLSLEGSNAALFLMSLWFLRSVKPFLPTSISFDGEDGDDAETTTVSFYWAVKAVSVASIVQLDVNLFAFSFPSFSTKNGFEFVKNITSLLSKE